MRHEPAASIIELFAGTNGVDDGVKAVAAVLKCPESRVRNWLRKKGSNGTGGIIPHKYIPKLIEAAAAAGRDLQPGDFVTAARLSAAGAQS